MDWILPLLLSLSCAAGVPLSRAASGQRNRLLLISFDGFRWDYDRDVETPHLDQLGREGVRAKYISPPMLTMTSPLALHHHLRQMGGGPRAQNQGLKTGSFYFPGGAVNYGGQAVNRVVVEVPRPANETEWKQNIDTVLSWFSEEDFHLVTLYFGEPDRVGHKKGPDHPDRKTMIRLIDRTIGYLRESIARLHLSDSLNVILTSDHGMTTVKKRPEVEELVLNKYLNLVKLNSFEILDYGGFGILTPRPGKEQDVFDALSKAPNLTVYKKNEFPESFHLAKSKRLPPIVVVADLGFNLNSRFIVYVNKGDHGFHNSEMDMKTIFWAVGPDFKKNFLSEPFDSIHIYPLMCKVLQIDPAPHNGSLSVTEKLLLLHGGCQRYRVSVALLLTLLCSLALI
ncbi:hypothetical protein CgunFtcFv8_018999 [Champsocephalus gunnari]|uniref:Ectonucleotide pyrophosphatase/phosphodiesterase family member 7 n=1 Tax=Champsocephalus gunnari TaxID=52237 RepID=A0AAN8HNB2_CHAGU|nr:hypothetical protein CgunFtcFv8_018999 [Champsocephalus gunnari]